MPYANTNKKGQFCTGTQNIKRLACGQEKWTVNPLSAFIYVSQNKLSDFFFFYGSCDWREGWLLGKICFVALSLIWNFRSSLLRLLQEVLSISDHREKWNIFHSLWTQTHPGVEWKENEPSIADIFILSPFSTLFVFWWLDFSFLEGYGK